MGKGWLQNVKLRPLVEIKLARPIRSQDFRASINSIVPNTSLVNIDALLLIMKYIPALVYKKKIRFGIIDIRQWRLSWRNSS